ncbi:MAG: tyrosine-type recombinase/integrase [candidate division Zixibacteria bacterium]|nr:tyrosine-type recombinase/integrase [candidate division Zixibacteria bacterium]
MGFTGLLEQFEFDCRVRNLSPSTIETYGNVITYFRKWVSKELRIPFEQVSKTSIQRYILALRAKGDSDHTVNSRIRMLKIFFKYLERENLWSTGNPMMGISFIKAERRLKPVLSPTDISRLMAVPNRRRFFGHRDYVIMMVLYDTLIRISECIGIKVADVDLGEGTIKVFGKGRKERVVPIGQHLRRELHLYAVKWRKHIPDSASPLFPRRGGGFLDISGIRWAIKKYGRKAGVKVYPHLIRHSGATFWIQNGGQPFYLQNLMGHTSMQITQAVSHS